MIWVINFRDFSEFSSEGIDYIIYVLEDEIHSVFLLSIFKVRVNRKSNSHTSHTHNILWRVKNLKCLVCIAYAVNNLYFSLRRLNTSDHFYNGDQSEL